MRVALWFSVALGWMGCATLGFVGLFVWLGLTWLFGFAFVICWVLLVFKWSLIAFFGLRVGRLLLGWFLCLWFGGVFGWLRLWVLWCLLCFLTIVLLCILLFSGLVFSYYFGLFSVGFGLFAWLPWCFVAVLPTMVFEGVLFSCLISVSLCFLGLLWSYVVCFDFDIYY